MAGMDADAWKKRYEREKLSRKSAEKIAEDKTREIFYRNQELKDLADSLEEQVKDRTVELEQKNKSLEQNRDQLSQQQGMLQEINNALKEKAIELETLSRYKSEFLANVSHELRTPLNSLMILASMLLDNSDGNLTDDDLKSVRIIYNNANELLEIIEDILDISKAEAGALSVHKEDCLLSDITLSLRDQFQPLADEKGLTLSVVCEENLPEWLHTDKKRLKQVIKNLLSNAMKFTPEKGEISLTIKTGEWSFDRHDISEGLLFEVRDNGIGVPLEKHETIFQMFKQADGSTSRKYGGTGLGLAISRKLARLMGGDLSLESEEGKGACFTLKMPPDTMLAIQNHQTDNNDLFLGIESDEVDQFDNETILLVDDDLRNSFALSVLLQKRGLNVIWQKMVSRLWICWTKKMLI